MCRSIGRRYFIIYIVDFRPLYQGFFSVKKFLSKILQNELMGGL